MIVDLHDGPIEKSLRALLDQALAAQTTINARISSVDVPPASRHGEIRAYVEIRGPSNPDQAAWRQLAAQLCQHPSIDRAVAIPPSIHATLAPGALELLISETAGQPVLTARGDHPPTVVVFCSPNTNKPLHIGHLRACVLGMSMTRLLEATGIQVVRSQMLSNFGVHMCQALAMYDGVSTPNSAAAKGDHFVGNLYRRYHDAITNGADPQCDGPACANPTEGQPCLRCLPLHTLRKMAQGDSELLVANERLGQWAIDGILSTQARIGTSHHAHIREAEVIQVATTVLDEAVDAGVCARRADGSTYIPIQSTGDTELTLLRRDGTSLVFSMLLGVYLSRSRMYPGWDVIEFTGEQWRAGRTAMYEVLQRIGRPDIAAATEGVFFGMVKTQGRVMRSRSGSAVNADELLDSLVAWVSTWERCPSQVRADPAAQDRFGVAALKYHLLKFPRSQGFSFDEQALRHDIQTRFSALITVLEWIQGQPSNARPTPPSRRSVRSLALSLAREAAVTRRAISTRDPSVIIRYIDDLVEKSIPFVRVRAEPTSLGLPLDRLLRRALSNIDIDAADLVRVAN